MGIIYELPVGSQTGDETLLALRAVIEEYQSLVSVLQNNVVGSVLLFLQVKVVDIGIGTDNQLLLVCSTAFVSFVIAAAACNSHSKNHQSCHDEH